jgi:hypothetical protein
MIHLPILRHAVPDTGPGMICHNGVPIATNEISWDQPHEGNLFEHLYARRSIQPTVVA